MRASQLGQALLGLGVIVAVAATGAWILGFDPATLPPALLKIAAYKLVALAAVGLMAAGAVVTRSSRIAERQPERALPDAEGASVLGVGLTPELHIRDVADPMRERRN